MYLVFTRMPCERYRSLRCCCVRVTSALINSTIYSFMKMGQISLEVAYSRKLFGMILMPLSRDCVYETVLSIGHYLFYFILNCNTLRLKGCGVVCCFVLKDKKRIKERKGLSLIKSCQLLHS